ncbi:NINE protein [Xylophilus sp. Kf1]|nr:NINE protein [Xylophilus sp. Kf1]
MTGIAGRKNKTLAAWLAFLGGPLGLHRFYLGGWGDTRAWLMPIPTALGVYGLRRAQVHGLDDPWCWILIPLLGCVVAGTSLTAIVYGLTLPEKWNARHNPQAPTDASAGRSHWLTIFAVAGALLVGTGALMAALAFGFEHYFTYMLDQDKAETGTTTR